MAQKRTTEAAIKNYEKLLGEEAARKTQAYLRAVIQQKLGSRDGHVWDDSLIFSTKVKSKMGAHRLLGLNVEARKTAFILNYGFTGVREATMVYYSHPRYKVSSSERKSHSWKLPAFGIFDDIYEKSGAIDLLVEELANTRTDAVEIRINDMIMKFNRGKDVK